ncbi:FKBP-type peptidyl-prolyl cis-trans isomerase [Nocardioides sp. GXZ039]|uniref:FKBP-type peptidyl-prolyl cis-trans isomerase n=1 Tax=Nocardioides sp. GXZ039 TaxID=3136018 RepID=UPI0030F39E6F
MLRRLRRPAALVAPLLLLAGLLAACGSETPGNGLTFADRLDAVSISGDVGTAPKIEWKDRMEAGKLETDTAIEGDGAALADGDTVFVNFALADGYTRKTAVDTFGEDTAGVRLTVGKAPEGDPQTLSDVIAAFLSDHIGTDVTRGSRLVMTGNTEAFFGELALSPALAADNIGNDDGLLLVADILDVEQQPRLKDESQPSPSWAPKIVYTKGVPSALDFQGVPEPTKENKADTLIAATVKKGNGPEVQKGQLIVVDYLGQVYDGEKPFDQSFDAEPFATGIGVGQVVAGWDKLLVGKTVGSRVLLRIPPEEGYGDQAQGEDIPANSTLYFVVDILAAA